MSKVSKEFADYTDAPNKAQGRCRDCTMFRGGACTAVKGDIQPWAHCRLFERKPSDKHG